MSDDFSPSPPPFLRKLFKSLEATESASEIILADPTREFQEIFNSHVDNEDSPVFLSPTSPVISQHLQETRHEHHPARFLQIPNFIEAIFALVVSGILLAVCLIIIKKTKTWCIQIHRKKRISSDPEKPESGGEDDPEEEKEPTTTSSIEADENSKSSARSDNKSVSSSKNPTSSHSRQPSGHSNRSSSRKSHKELVPPRPAYTRRASGPFGEEALAHVEETYRGVSHYEDKQSSWARKLSSRRPSPHPEHRSRANP